MEGSPVKDLTLTLDCARPEPSKPGLLSLAKCTLDYKKEMFTLKAAYDVYPAVLACAGTYAYDSLTLGCSADYNTTKGAFSKYGAACQLVQPDFSVVAKLCVADSMACDVRDAGAFSLSCSSLQWPYALVTCTRLTSPMVTGLLPLARLQHTRACTTTKYRLTCRLVRS